MTGGSYVIRTPQLVAKGAAEDDGLHLGTIVVEGERFSRSVFDTAASVRAVSGSEIDANPGASDVQDVLAGIPNVTTFGQGNDAPSIRGQQSVGPLVSEQAFFSGTTPRATLTVDGRRLPFNEYTFCLGSVWDVDTFEIFRGPQTTSQGANSIAGAFYLRTNDPAFSTKGKLRFSAGNLGGRQISAMYNTQLIEDELAVRVALDYQTRDSFVSFNSPGQQLIPDLSELEQFTGRVKLLWEPAWLPGLSTKLTYSRTDSRAPQTENIDQPFKKLTRTSNPVPPPFTNKSDTLIHDISYEFSPSFALSNKFYLSDFESDRSLHRMDL
ncbi:MAG: TonB-dependent receptor [Pseudomonadota bacterium]